MEWSGVEKSEKVECRMNTNKSYPDFLKTFPDVPDAKGNVIICPGGGYQILSPRESDPVAAAFAARGWQPFVLHYPVKDKHRSTPLFSEPLLALGKAVSELRACSSARLTVCGFSAGGHLAASLGVHWRDLDSQFGANVHLHPRHTSCRPDGVILSYPVISMITKFHNGSMENLTGGSGPMREYFSLENQVSSDTVPVFLWHTAEDSEVSVENSLMFFSALDKLGISVEMHIFPRGVHGLSLATPEVDQPEKNRFSNPHVAQWFSLALEWLDEIPENSLKG